MKQIITILTIIIALCASSQKAVSKIVPEKYNQFLSCFSDSTCYAIENISGHEILFVSQETFPITENNVKAYHAIAAQIYTLDTKGKIVCLGEARSQGTLYPLAISNGTLLTAGHHFVNRYTFDINTCSLSLTESAEATFNNKGKASYTYENRVTNEYSYPKNDEKLTTLFTETEKASPITFKPYKAENSPSIRNAFVRPLPTGIDLNNIKDAMVSASFSTKDINWRGSNLTMTIYAQQIYDTVDLHQIQTGDSILYSNDTIIVNSKEEKDGKIVINGGYDNNGLTLWPYEGGAYRAVQYDDHSVYVEVGKAEFPISNNFTITDCHEDPQAPSTTITNNQKQYLDKLNSSRKEFSYLDTIVRIENGTVTNITRHWIP